MRQLTKKDALPETPTICDVLDKHGITLEKLVKKGQQLIEATEVKVFCPKDGEIKYSKKLAALKIQQNQLDMFHKLRGDFAPEKLEIHTSELQTEEEKVAAKEAAKRYLEVLEGKSGKQTSKKG